MFKIICVGATALLLFQQAYAHNENIPGPHGGRTQMPANFHTEVVADQDGSLHVYLLDMEFKNPSVKNSDVRAYIVGKNKKKTTLKCRVMGGDHFHCKGTKPTKTGDLVLKVKREGSPASMDARYQLPLKPFESPTTDTPPQMEDHSGHH